MNIRRLSATLVLSFAVAIAGCDSPSGGKSADVANNATNVALDAVCENIQTTLNKMEIDLKSAAGKLARTGIRGIEAEDVLSAICQLQPHVIDASIVSPEGKMTLVMPDDYKKYQGTIIVEQEQVRQVIDTKSPVLSKIFETVEGVQAVDYEWPIIDANGQYLGSLSIIFNPADIIGDAIAKVAIDKDWQLSVAQLDSQLLFGGKLAKRVASSYPTIFTCDNGAIVSPPQASDKSPASETHWATVESSGTKWRIITFRTTSRSGHAGK